MQNILQPQTLSLVFLLFVACVAIVIIYFVDLQNEDQTISEQNTGKKARDIKSSEYVVKIDLSGLENQIKARFNKEELELFCTHHFDGMTLEDIRYDTRKGLVSELIQYMHRRNLLEDLIVALMKERTQVDWSAIIKT